MKKRLKDTMRVKKETLRQLAPVEDKPPQPVDTVWDCLLPAEVRVLPHDLALLDQALWGPSLLAPFQSHWDQAARGQGRPTIPMATYLRLMVVKHRTGWRYAVP